VLEFVGAQLIGGALAVGVVKALYPAVVQPRRESACT
jgi:hypothetical protein